MTWRIGVTGGIGSGKSLVCRIFELLGVPVYHADDRAKYLMENDPELKERLLETFGEAIFPGGKLDRKALAAKVFGNAKLLKSLNALVHPAVRQDTKSWFEEQSAPYAIKEAALIYETGAEQGLDRVIVVTAPLGLRLKRVHQRDGSSYRDILARINHQLPEKEKVKRADYLIRNNGKRSLIAQVIDIHQAILKELDQGKIKKQ